MKNVTVNFTHAQNGLMKSVTARYVDTGIVCVRDLIDDFQTVARVMRTLTDRPLIVLGGKATGKDVVAVLVPEFLAKKLMLDEGFKIENATANEVRVDNAGGAFPLLGLLRANYRSRDFEKLAPGTAWAVENKTKPDFYIFNPFDFFLLTATPQPRADIMETTLRSEFPQLGK